MLIKIEPAPEIKVDILKIKIVETQCKTCISQNEKLLFFNFNCKLLLFVNTCIVGKFQPRKLRKVSTNLVSQST